MQGKDVCDAHLESYSFVFLNILNIGRDFAFYLKSCLLCNRLEKAFKDRKVR